MSAVATAARTGAANDATPSARSGPGVRLLLPPIAEPPASAIPLATVMAGPLARSVLSPVTAGPWPGAGPVAPVTPPPLPDPTKLCGSVVLAAVEALGGSRPVVQLARWVSPQVFESLAAASRRQPPRAASAAPGQRTASPARRATVRRTHLFRVSASAAEASVVVHDGSRVRAAAVRLEVHRGHWRATVLQIG
jgi:hypothetical protein